MRERYGRNTFGQSCLVARRLVERGVPYVTINSKGWDTHKQHFQTMRQKLPELDKGLATLLQDLARPRPAGQHHRLVLRRVRPDAQGPVGGALERRARPLRQGLLRPGRRRRIQGRPRRRRLRRQGRGGEGSAGLSARPDRQHVRAARHRPRRHQAAEPGGLGPPPDAGGARRARRSRRPAGRRSCRRGVARDDCECDWSVFVGCRAGRRGRDGRGRAAAERAAHRLRLPGRRPAGHHGPGRGRRPSSWTRVERCHRLRGGRPRRRSSASTSR